MTGKQSVSIKDNKFKNNKYILALVLFLAIGLALFLFIKSPLFAVELTTKETHLEVGTSTSQNPSDYLGGRDWCVALSFVDTSAVKKNTVGRYPVTIYHGLNKYTSYVNIIDTTAPVISCDVKKKTIAVGETISVNTLGLHIVDHSEIESIAFTKISSEHFYTGLPDEDIVEMKEAYAQGLPMWAEDFQFAFGGIYTLTISVTDQFHNTGEIELLLTVEAPPVIEAPADIYVAQNNKIDFTEHISTWDFIDGDIDTSTVEIDTSKLNLNSPGDYVVSFTATDNYGLTSQAYSTVHVHSRDKLQELLNTHQLTLGEHIIIGAYNPYDSGYYNEKDINFIQDVMEPTLVHIYNDKLDTFGSGFILEITDDVVTIATNEHVITDDLIVDLTFFDATACEGSVVASDARDDIAFIRIPVTTTPGASSLDQNFVQTLRTVHINLDYWNHLAESPNLDICYNCIDNNGESWIKNQGKLLEKDVLRDWNEFVDVNESIISMDPVPGSSGSPIFDTSGRLVAMVRGFTTYADYTDTVAVPLNRILKYFEVVFKYKVHYQ